MKLKVKHIIFMFHFLKSLIINLLNVKMKHETKNVGGKNT